MSDIPLRIQRRRTKGWRMPANTVSVARPGNWGNLWKISPPRVVGDVHVPEMTAAGAVATHKEWIEWVMESWPGMRKSVQKLRGRNLACWCRLCPAHAAGKPFGVRCDACAPCHADTLGRIANGLTCEVVSE